MPFVRTSRDKRGYEHFFLIQPEVTPRGKVRQRVLYWFRTPPGIRVGRDPFDDETIRAIEAKNPGVTFDWETLRNTPVAPAQPEYWRERRRAERAARSAQPQESEDIGEDREGELTRDSDPGSNAPGFTTGAPTVDAPIAEPSLSVVDETKPAGQKATGGVPEEAAAGPDPGQAPRRRRRRRRGRGGRERDQGSAVKEGADSDQTGMASESSIDPDEPPESPDDGSTG